MQSIFGLAARRTSSTRGGQIGPRRLAKNGLDYAAGATADLWALNWAGIFGGVQRALGEKNVWAVCAARHSRR
jgi:hypothetical protein